MGVVFFYILALTENTISTVGVALIGCFGTLLSIWIKSRITKQKAKKNSFQNIIDANTAYREEIRKDLKHAKEEVLACKTIIEKLEKKVKDLEAQLEYYQQLHKKSEDVDD